MSKQPPAAPTVSAAGPCPTVIQIVGCPGTGSLPSTIAPPDPPPPPPPIKLVGWLVWGLTALETVFQYISGHLPKRGRERKERIDESKDVQTTPTRTYCKCSRPLPYCNPNCRTPRHWKFTQHHRTTRPPLPN